MTNNKLPRLASGALNCLELEQALSIKEMLFLLQVARGTGAGANGTVSAQSVMEEAAGLSKKVKNIGRLPTLIGASFLPYFVQRDLTALSRLVDMGLLVQQLSDIGKPKCYLVVTEDGLHLVNWLVEALELHLRIQLPRLAGLRSDTGGSNPVSPPLQSVPSVTSASS